MHNLVGHAYIQYFKSAELPTARYMLSRVHNIVNSRLWGAICVKIQNFMNMLVFTKMTGIYDHIAIYILVFMHHNGICVRYWYLHLILVFTCTL